MTGVIATIPRFQFSNAQGHPLAAGMLFTYLAGTTTPAKTYQDKALTIENTNPIRLDARGECVLWLDPAKSYKFVLRNALGVIQWTQDNVSGAFSGHDERPVQVETQTSTRGQKEFTLKEISYTPGIGALHVFVDGFRIVPAAYEETARNKVTFKRGLHQGAEVLFETGSSVNSQSAVDAALVPFQPADGVPSNVQDKLREFVSMADRGAAGDGVADDLAKINAAILALHLAGGGELRFGPKTYGVSGEVVLRSNVRLSGVPGATRIKLIAAKDSQVLSHPYRGTADYLDNVTIRGIIFDGNYAIQPGAVSNSVATFDPCRNLVVEDSEFCYGNGYGVGFQSGPGMSDPRQSENVTMRRVKIHHNGNMGGYDGLDVKAVSGMTLEQVDSYNNVGDGIDLRGLSIHLLNCRAWENGESGIEISASAYGTSQNTSITVDNCLSHTNKYGMRLASGATGTGFAHIAVNGGRYSNNTLDGIVALNSGGRVSACISGVRNYGNGQHGISCQVSHHLVAVMGCYLYSNGGSGLQCNGDGAMRVTNTRSTLNTGYGYEEGANGLRNTIGSGCDFRGNTLGSVLLGPTRRVHIAADFMDYDLGTSNNGDIIASAAEISLPYGGSMFHITGVNPITTIAGSFRNRVISLSLPQGITINHAGGLNAIRLMNGASITTTTVRSVLQLIFDGTNWRQVAYAANT